MPLGKIKPGTKLKLIKDDYSGTSNYSKIQGLEIGNIYILKEFAGDWIRLKNFSGNFTLGCFEVIEEKRIVKEAGISKFLNSLGAKI